MKKKKNKDKKAQSVFDILKDLEQKLVRINVSVSLFNDYIQDMWSDTGDITFRKEQKDFEKETKNISDTIDDMLGSIEIVEDSIKMFNQFLKFEERQKNGEDSVEFNQEYILWMKKWERRFSE